MENAENQVKESFNVIKNTLKSCRLENFEEISTLIQNEVSLLKSEINDLKAKHDDSFYIFAARLLRVWLAVNQEDSMGLVSYLNTNYGMDLKNKQEISYLLGFSKNGSNYIKNKKFQHKLKLFVEKEKEGLLQKITA